MSDNNYAVFEKPRFSLRRTLLRGSFTQNQQHREGEYRDTLYVKSTIGLSMKDRIRVLFGAVIHLDQTIAVEHIIGNHYIKESWTNVAAPLPERSEEGKGGKGNE